ATVRPVHLSSAVRSAVSQHFQTGHKAKQKKINKNNFTGKGTFSQELKAVMRPRDVIQLGMVLSGVLLMLYIVTNPPQYAWKRARKILNNFGSTETEVIVHESPKAIHYKCGLPQECPVDHFAFHIKSGAANVVGPKICFEDHIIMSSVKNNIGPGLNIALINGETGNTEKFDAFNMYSGDVKELLQFMKEVRPGMIVLVASYDDPASKLTDEARDVFVHLGSTMVKSVGFRDSWIFASATGRDKSHFEGHIKNEKEKNVYDGWPEMLELGGCFPRKL
ncbi:hypothetical protein AAFF_G00103200, partial [Aldrovandia affinis]